MFSVFHDFLFVEKQKMQFSMILTRQLFKNLKIEKTKATYKILPLITLCVEWAMFLESHDKPFSIQSVNTVTSK